MDRDNYGVFSKTMSFKVWLKPSNKFFSFENLEGNVNQHLKSSFSTSVPTKISISTYPFKSDLENAILVAKDLTDKVDPFKTYINIIIFFERESLKSAVRHLICCENRKSSKIAMNKAPYCVHCTDNCSCGEEKEHQFWKHISMTPTRIIKDPSEDVTLPPNVGHLFYHIGSMPAGVHFK